jgi:dipeptidyl aminopeptidase/acylaminoacyl peptidase
MTMLKDVLSILLFCAWAYSTQRSPALASDVWHVEPTPTVVAQDMSFSNGDTRLMGTVYLPENGDHLPAVVALHGASDATRSAALYRHLREGLPAMGIAVLIYDRRGSGESSGSRSSVDYETLADDAIAGQNALAKLPRIDPKKIGFWGLSQGGWLAVLAASRSENAAFAVSVSAPLVTPEKQMEFATTNLLTVRGYSRTDSEGMLEARRIWIAYLRGKASRAEALNGLRRAEAQSWFELAFLPRAAKLTTDPEHSSARKEMSYDPIAVLRSVKQPLLFIYGGSDPWIPVGQSLKQLENISKQQHNIRYAVIADASHEMMFRARETMAFDAKTLSEDAPQASAYFMLMASWLGRQLRN